MNDARSRTSHPERPASRALPLRKEKPLPPPKPPAPPPKTGGIRAPGNSGGPGRMICAAPVEETLLESSAQKVLRKPSSLGGKSIHLTIVEGHECGRSFDLTGVGTYTIGRGECDVVLQDEKISRKHASVVVAREGAYSVSDLASRNGTFINGVRLSRRNLQHNDLIRVGDTTLRFTVFDGPVPIDR